MILEVFKIKKEIEKDKNFSTIKEIDVFAERLYYVYMGKCDIPDQIRRAGIWVESNRPKKNYKRFLVNWLNRTTTGWR